MYLAAIAFVRLYPESIFRSSSVPPADYGVRTFTFPLYSPLFPPTPTYPRVHVPIQKILTPPPLRIRPRYDIRLQGTRAGYLAMQALCHASLYAMRAVMRANAAAGIGVLSINARGEERGRWTAMRRLGYFGLGDEIG